jgi:hypothetical protein
MTPTKLQKIVQSIVKKATELKNKHTDEINAPVNYACVFSQTNIEYKELLKATSKIGKIIQETPSGFLFHINDLETTSGILKLLKIRFPDSTRPERGDADFTIANFAEFEEKYLPQKEFKIIKKPDFYMIELMDPAFNVRAYFSNPPLDKELAI